MTPKMNNVIAPLKLVSNIFAGIFILAFFVYIFFIADIDLFLNSDYLSFLTGAKIVAEGKGTQIYDFSTQLAYQTKIKLSYKDQIKLYPKDKLDKALPYRNLPFLAFLLIPLTFLPAFLSFKIFAALNLVLLFLLLRRISTTELKKTGLDLLVFVAFIFIPVLTSIVRGQLTLIALAFFYLLYENIKKGRSYMSGIIAGLLLIKPQYLFAIPFLVIFVPEVKSFFRGFLVTAGLLGLLSFLISGTQVLQYPKFILFTEQANYGSVPVEILTIFSVFRRILNSDVLALFINMFIYLITLGIFMYNKRAYSLKVGFGIAITSTLLFGIHMTDNEVVLMLLPMLLMIEDTFKKIWVFIFMTFCIIAPLLRFTVFAFWEIAFIVGIEAVLFLSARNKKINEKSIY